MEVCEGDSDDGRHGSGTSVVVDLVLETSATTDLVLGTSVAAELVLSASGAAGPLATMADDAQELCDNDDGGNNGLQ
uniref:Uncharacterized protein n=1 Tax=Oryza glumipatula TaxID=40148 RepID=A0A0E0AQK0_9ORYZ